MTQNDTQMVAITAEEPAKNHFDGAALLSIGGIVAALGAATCCVVPFALFFAGISGAWIGNLTAFEPYQPVFVTIALACLGYGFYLVYRKPRVTECVEGSYCARPSSHRNAKIGLWIATVLIIVAMGFPHAVRLFLTA
ncbi:mercuric transporter MerT family protein [Rhizobiales bacterium 3FA27D7]|jgi:mercuric ion transport protein|uniref:mercuric transporter MerT family protein n=1 Tax=Mesorhizobium sp. 2RAF21 TaxID=3232995 RepID=UPI0010F80BDD